MSIGKSDPPPAPDYAGAATATAAGNLEASRAAATANRVNQVTPYGNLNYGVTGQDSYGNDVWTATQTLSPAQQQLLDQQNRTSAGLAGLQDKGLDYVSGILSKPFSTDNLPSLGFNPGQTAQDAIFSRLNPQITQDRQALDVKLANQGIPLGSEAYTNAMRLQSNRENDLYNQAAVSGLQTGMQARQQGFQENAYQRNEPLNTLNAVRTGAQVTGPSFVNPAQQATTSGPDLFGATNATYQANLGNVNAQNAQMGNFTNGLFSLGSAKLLASDRRLKRNITRIGTHKTGIGLYGYDYINGERGCGVMADEAITVMPSAVHTLPSGYMVVDYGVLNG
jgi:hypothetical protein